ncbi:GNAT family N-acetyltransferase [Streptomyces sp. NPDC006660]|uniref:GNAT family N-acetyltransferase n=1 Tax=unclassified Streptomyces TaxID=2593676 RepID=UPI003410C2A3
MTGMTGTLRVEAALTAGALVLRPWRHEDAEQVIEAYGDVAIARWVTRPIKTLEDAQRWLEFQSEGRRTGTRLAFAICEDQPGDAGGQLLGNIVLKWPEHPSREVGEIGYWTMPYARGRGVAPRAVETLSAWAFDSYAAEGLHRLELIHQEDNPASCRVAEKAGYHFDRILPATPPYPRDGHLHVRHAGH